MRYLLRLMRYVLRLLRKHATLLYNQFHLSRLIKGNKILVIGTGVSAHELERVPSGCLIFTCNFGLKLLKQIGFTGGADLYLTYRWFCEKIGFKEMLEASKVKYLLIDNVDYIRGIRSFRGSFQYLFRDSIYDHLYLKRLIYPNKVCDIAQTGLSHTSTGIRLLQLALFFKAKEIYLIGVDVNENGYYDGSMNINEHINIDTNFIKIVSSRYRNVFSLSKNSPISQYFPHRELMGAMRG